MLDALIVGAFSSLNHGFHRVANLFAMGHAHAKPRDILIGPHALRLMHQGVRTHRRSVRFAGCPGLFEPERRARRRRSGNIQRAAPGTQPRRTDRVRAARPRHRRVHRATFRARLFGRRGDRDARRAHLPGIDVSHPRRSARRLPRPRRKLDQLPASSCATAKIASATPTSFALASIKTHSARLSPRTPCPACGAPWPLNTARD